MTTLLTNRGSNKLENWYTYTFEIKQMKYGGIIKKKIKRKGIITFIHVLYSSLRFRMLPTIKNQSKKDFLNIIFNLQFHPFVSSSSWTLLQLLLSSIIVHPPLFIFSLMDISWHSPIFTLPPNNLCIIACLLKIVKSTFMGWKNGFCNGTSNPKACNWSTCYYLQNTSYTLKSPPNSVADSSELFLFDWDSAM